MGKCQRCESLPGGMTRAGVLYLSPPMQPTFSTIQSALESVGCSVRDIGEQTIEVPLTCEGAVRVCEAFSIRLSRMELEDTKCLFLGAGEIFGADKLHRVTTLAGFMSVNDNRWFLTLLQEERIESWFQPIVHSACPKDVFAYECLVRGRDETGEIISPFRLFDTARASELIFYLDRVCRTSAIRAAATHDITEKVFINFNPTSIYNPEHCLKSTMKTIQHCGLANSQIVFEVVETDQIRDIGHLLNIVGYYKAKGFGIALDDLGAGYSSLNLLHQIKPDYIKVDLELIQGVHKNPAKGVIVKNILAISKELGCRSIAEGVEDKEDLHWLQTNGADYVQGFLFAKPSPAPGVPNPLC